MNQPIIRARPNKIEVQRRRRNCVEHASLRRLRIWLRAKLANAFGRIESLAREIGTNLFPTTPAIFRLPQRVRGKEEHVRIDRREDHRLGAHDAKIAATKWFGHDVLCLRDAAIVTRQLAAVDNVRIKWIGNNITVFFGADRMPFAESDLAIVAATGNARRAALLLATAQTIRKRIICVDMIHLRRGLVVPTTP